MMPSKKLFQPKTKTLKPDVPMAGLINRLKKFHVFTGKC